jgi:hypothetical protein
VTIAINALVPIASVLLGAGLTYWLNVRGRRRNNIEDAFNAAISAVAVADASKHYLKQTAKPDHMPDRMYRDLLAEIAGNAIRNHTQRCGEAREAIAKVMQYEPRIKAFYEDAQAITDHPDEIVSLLMGARSRFVQSRRQSDG